MPRAADAAQQAEARRLLALHGGAEGQAKAMETLRWQFAVIQSRTQLLLTLATITLTITGFSGQKIAGSGSFARWAMAVGLCLVLSAVLLMLAGLRVRWLTLFEGESPEAILADIIVYRDAKTLGYRLQTALLGGGLASYVSAVIAYLSQPG